MLSPIGFTSGDQYPLYYMDLVFLVVSEARPPDSSIYSISFIVCFYKYFQMAILEYSRYGYYVLSYYINMNLMYCEAQQHREYTLCQGPFTPLPHKEGGGEQNN